MFNYWFLLFFVSGTIGLILLVKKSVKRGSLVAEETLPEDASLPKITVDLEKLEIQTKKILEKLLRRCRIIILRLDNNVTKVLKNLKKEAEERKDFSVTKLNEYTCNSEDNTISVLEVNYIESVQSNPTVETCLKLAKIYKSRNDLNTCHALLFRAWEINKEDKMLKEFVKDIYEESTSKK